MHPPITMTPEILALLTQLSTTSTSTSTPPPPYTSCSTNPLAASSPKPAMSRKVTTSSAVPMSITLDTSIRVMGHCNTLHLPHLATTDPAKLAAMVTLALNGHESSEGRGVEVRVQAGINVCGSKNVIVMGGAVGKAGMKKNVDCDTSGGAAATDDARNSLEEGQPVVGRKRKNDEEESAREPGVKKATTKDVRRNWS